MHRRRRRAIAEALSRGAIVVLELPVAAPCSARVPYFLSTPNRAGSARKREHRWVSPPPNPPPPLRAPPYPPQTRTTHIGGLHVPLALSQEKLHPISSSGTPVRRAPSRAPPRELCLRRQRRHPRAPSILDRPILIQRARLDQLNPSPGADGSRSNGPNINLPLRPVTLAKETLPFLDINPPSICMQN